MYAADMILIGLTIEYMSATAWHYFSSIFSLWLVASADVATMDTQGWLYSLQDLSFSLGYGRWEESKIHL